MSDVGVVDPIRLPRPVQDLVGRFRGLPLVAQIFIVLAALEALLHTFGILETGLYLGSGLVQNLVNLIVGYGPRGAEILLPAVLLIRRPTAPVDTPWIYRGAILLALLTLLTAPTNELLSRLAPNGPDNPQLGFATVESILFGVADVMLGLGLAALNPKVLRAVYAGYANLAAIGILVGALAFFLAVIVRDQRLALSGQFEPLWLSLLGGLQWLGIAYLLRAVVRGLDDPSRSETATRVGAAASLMWAAGVMVTQVIATIGLLTQSGSVPVDLAQGFELLEDIAPLLLVAAFWLGLADPLRPLPSEWEAAAAS